MPPLTIPLAFSVCFTLGCVLIHALRLHAERLTAVLGIAAAALGLVLATMTLLDAQAAHRALSEDSVAFVGFP